MTASAVSDRPHQDGRLHKGLVRDIAALMGRALDRTSLLRLGGAVLAALAASALAIAAPIALKHIVDALAGENLAASASGGLIMLYVGALWAGRVAEQAQAYLFGTGEQRLQQRLNALLFAHVLSLPMHFHLDRQTGAVAQTLTLGLQGARLILNHAVFTLFPVTVQAALATGVIFAFFGGEIALIVLAALVGYGLVFAWGVKRLAAPTRAVSAAQVEAGGQFNDGLINVEPVKAFGAEPQIESRYRDLLSEAERKWRTFHARRAENGVLASFVFAAALSLVLASGARAISAGGISIGDFVLLSAYMLQLVRPIEMLGFSLRDIAQGAGYLERALAMLRIAPERKSQPRTAKQAQAKPERSDLALNASAAPIEIQFENVSFAYSDEREVLFDVSFAAPAGKTTAIVGPSGAGKSSLVRLMLRYYAPGSGRILFDGRDISAMNIEEARAMVAVVSQDTALFNASLGRNIALADPGASQARIEAAAARARLVPLLETLPHGLETFVGERGLKLSGGERQRVAIARAALKDAPVFVFDEATSALDSQTEAEVAKEMFEAAAGRTALIITHRLALAAGAAHIVVLDGGRVVEQGCHRALLAEHGLYARLWLKQHERSRADATI